MSDYISQTITDNRGGGGGGGLLFGIVSFQSVLDRVDNPQGHTEKPVQRQTRYNFKHIFGLQRNSGDGTPNVKEGVLGGGWEACAPPHPDHSYQCSQGGSPPLHDKVPLDFFGLLFLTFAAPS